VTGGGELPASSALAAFVSGASVALTIDRNRLVVLVQRVLVHASAIDLEVSAAANGGVPAGGGGVEARGPLMRRGRQEMSLAPTPVAGRAREHDPRPLTPC
jgi:hypothetical protein